MWRITKNEPGNRTATKQLPLAFKSKNTNIHLDFAAEIFNCYFLNLIDNLKTENMDTDSARLFLKNSIPKVFKLH